MRVFYLVSRSKFGGWEFSHSLGREYALATSRRATVSVRPNPVIGRLLFAASERTSRIGWHQVAGLSVSLLGYPS
jgi:hypothetical protein